ncbi:MAG TPA: cyanophycin synthetase [Ornithinibacter sp.]|jgi:cyanophycin synthetase|uniref:cyanophycin synthetase n=1 Tax=Ornithinibacter sp. TaxID=2862748 RepID=UPI001B4F6048|nr:cyanophycin synthetase [Ornithinibacter sp.]MBP6524538.1 cyanophycin synthetase [Dermatophilaceae bacterium]MBU9943087.1 cyanophycin synthetase [Dermatophilaceae bacterium]HOB79217.1 cyanophycin synthetase [Ornithinibacter sp.]HQA12931.1 cyanophycin synthetase [Ornithinibacter sp.]HQV82176.1 cyanophycin synthetase [Ornithinibacter sp.]
MDLPTPTGPAAPDLRILESRVYRGGNIWSYDPSIHLVVDLGILEEYPTSALPGFTERLVELLPGLENHTCSTGVKGGFISRMQQGTWLGHVAEHVALQLQQEAGHDQRRGKTRMVKGRPGVYNIIYAYTNEEVGLAAGRLAVALVNDLVQAQEDFDFAEELERFLTRAERTAFGPSTGAILEEAVSRDIPFIRLNSGSLVQLGQGVHQQRIRATMTSKTGALAVDIASDKDMTTKLLASAGLPVPKQETVRSAEGAVAAARRIGFPVVLKPLDGNHGRGVCLNLMDDEAVREAFVIAEDQSRRGYVIVESFVTGRDYRCLIVGGKMQAIAERVPAHVVGDGTHTVRELVDLTNADPRRGVGHEKVLTKIKVDAAAEELVREQGFTLDDVPPVETMVKLALTGNMSTGGISIDRTFDAHPDNIEIAEEAARLIGLDVAGIDFIAPDIASPVREAGGAICEVNAAPGFRMHTHPTVGEPQYIAKPVVDLLFPPGAPSRVPIVAVTGTNGKTTTSRMIAHIMKGLGRQVGMTSTDGIVIDERLVVKSDASGPRSARMVLQNPRVDFAVMEVARGGILREGLGYDRNDVAVVTNVAPDHLGMRGIDTLEQLADVKAVVVEAVPRDGFAVLNADDPLVRRMRRRCSGSVVWFSLAEPGSKVRDLIDDHCRRGGRAVVLDRTDRGDMIVIRHGRRSMQLAWTHLLPATFGGTALFNVANAMAAAGAAFASGAGLHEIRQGLRTFTTSYYLSPGRMNQVNVHNVDVIVDYCHNAPGMRVLGEFLERYASMKSGQSDLGKISRIGMVATAGDRREADMIELGAVAAEHFDVVVVREDERLRGRERGFTADLVAQGVRSRMGEPGVRCRQVEIVLDETDAVRHVMARANPGDIVVLTVDQHAAVMSELEAMTKQAQPGSHTKDSVGDPDMDPEAMMEQAKEAGDSAARDLEPSS